MKPETQRLLAAIRVGLTAFPELRVGQLLENALSDAHWGDRGPVNFFYVPDAEMAEAIERYVKKATGVEVGP